MPLLKSRINRRDPDDPLVYPREPGGKTQGVLVMGGDQIPLVSGLAGPARSMPQGSPGFDLILKTHVEGHAAALMHQQGVSQATLFLNNIPCITCNQNLPRALPQGATLNVVGPDGTKFPFKN